MSHLLPIAILVVLTALGFTVLVAAQSLSRAQGPGLVDPVLTGGRR